MTSAAPARRTPAAVLDRSALALRAAALLLLLTFPARATEIEPVADFGPNPGRLLMYRYVPDDLPTGMPLVVALHGCTQDARSFAERSGWVDLADSVGFALLLPEQPPSNNRDRCFTFFSERHNRRGAGEAASIASMIEHMLRTEGSRLARAEVYITGLSAGAGMAIAMLAAYPELFAGGASVAGVPYGCAATGGSAWLRMQRWWFGLSNPFGEAGWASWRCGIARYGLVNAGVRMGSAEEWRERVEEAGGDADATRARLTLWQGDADATVDPGNLAELVKQWTAVHGIDAEADAETSAGRLRIRSYADEAGRVLVESVEVRGLGHAQPVDPGPGPGQCGAVGPHLEDLDICAARRIAEFWGISVR